MLFQKKLIFIATVFLGLAVLLVCFLLHYKPLNRAAKTSINVEVKDEFWENAVKKGQLNIAIFPYLDRSIYYSKDNQLIGYDVDLINELSRRLNMRVALEEFNDFGKMLDAVKNGGSDLAVSSIIISPERARYMQFSKPYLYASINLVVRKDENNFKNLSDLKDHYVAVVAGSISESLANEVIGPANVVKLKTVDLLVMENVLTQRKVSAVLYDCAIGASMVNDKNKKIKTVNDRVASEDYGIAMRLNAAVMREKIDNTLEQMRQDGFLKKLLDKWITAANTPPMRE